MSSGTGFGHTFSSLPMRMSEEVEAMILALKHTLEWEKMQDLEGQNLNAQVKEYLKIYGRS